MDPANLAQALAAETIPNPLAANPGQSIGQSLGGETQAPSLTADTLPLEAPTPEGSQPQFTPEQFQELQARYAELEGKFQTNEQLLTGIKTIAEQQEQERRQQQFQGKMRQDLASVYEKAINANSSEEGLEILFNHLNSTVQGVETTLQQQVDEAWKDVEKSFWQATAPSFAQSLVAEKGLLDSDLPRLMEAANETEMVRAASTIATERQRLMQEYGQGAAAAAAARLKASGVLSAPAEAGMVPQPQITAGATNKELRPAIAAALGLSLTR